MGARVALVHDWLVSQRGGEAVLESLIRLFPDAPIYTLVADRAVLSDVIAKQVIHTSILGRALGSQTRHFRKFLPIFPSAMENFDFREFDFIVSTSHCVAKSAGRRHSIPHLSYIHTPMRYVWDQWPHYAPKDPLRRTLASPLRLYLQRWDRASSQGSHLRFIANSSFVSERIRTVWNRKSDVIYPPVDAQFFNNAPMRQRDGWCVVSALVPYKRVELAVQWATSYRQRLVVVGEGPERAKLEAIGGPTVTFLGRVPRPVIRDILSTSLGLIFPGIEDFGIVPLEAMATGTPVVAFGEGGALETVVEGPEAHTGVFFKEDTPASVEEAVGRLVRGWEASLYQPKAMRRWVEKFSVARFDAELGTYCRRVALELGVPGVLGQGEKSLD